MARRRRTGWWDWTPRSAASAVALAAVFGAALMFVPSDRPQTGASSRLPDLALPSLGGPSVPLASCPTHKCLTVVVAPWCGYCRTSTPKIKELKAYLASEKVATRIVVAMDKPKRVKDYAREFGKGTLIDADGEFSVRGVPHFIVSMAGGEVLQTQAGVPPGGIQDVAEFAAHFGLP